MLVIFNTNTSTTLLLNSTIQLYYEIKRIKNHYKLIKIELKFMLQMNNISGPCIPF